MSSTRWNCRKESHELGGEVGSGGEGEFAARRPPPPKHSANSFQWKTHLTHRAMGTRDDFSPEVKRALEYRAGNCCSFPGCAAVTAGPSDENKMAVSKTGMACHIAAAASGPGARRYDAKMSKEERTAIENGVWMCYTHGKLIDTDERRFTIPMLKKWREFAEFRAKFRQQFGDRYTAPSTQTPRDRVCKRNA